MGYFLGKDNTGDLASVLSGAYNVSSPAGSLPALNAAVPATTAATTVTTPAVTTTETPCMASCKEERRICLQEARTKDGRAGGPASDICEQLYQRCAGNCNVGGGCQKDSDCPFGQVCSNGTCKEHGNNCVTDANCTGGMHCVNGICVAPDQEADCPEGKGKTYEGCACGEEYNTKTGKCPVGYVFQKKPLGGTPVEGVVGACICRKALDEWGAKQKGNLGEYAYPPEMQSLMDLLLSRGKDLLGMPTGYSQEAQDKMFGRGFENVRAGEAGTRNTMEQGLSRQGMLGTGAGQGMLNDLSWNTEGNVANLARDLFVANEEKKKQDLIDYTTAAQSMLGSGMSFQQLLEAINASRRGEGSAALQSLLAWLLSQK